MQKQNKIVQLNLRFFPMLIELFPGSCLVLDLGNFEYLDIKCTNHSFQAEGINKTT